MTSFRVLIADDDRATIAKRGHTNLRELEVVDPRFKLPINDLEWSLRRTGNLSEHERVVLVAPL